MGLEEKEIKLLIEKLRKKYLQYSKEFNRTWFNPESFEDRLQMAVQNGMNLGGFILAEIAHFEKLREKYDKKTKTGTFSERVDSIMEENIRRIKKYPPLFFHSMGDVELVHLYGALSEFAAYDFPVLWLTAVEDSHRNRLLDSESNLNFLALPQGRKPSKRIQDHILVLKRPANQRLDIDIEKDKNNYLRESAFLMYNIIELCDMIIEKRSNNLELPLHFDKFQIESSRRKKIVEKYSEYTGYGAILVVRERCVNILRDFRLEAFTGKPSIPS